MVQGPSNEEELRLWDSVDRYFYEELGASDEALATALSDLRSAGLPEIQVSPLQGKFLFLLAIGLRARRILEVGTLAGYSTIWLARGLAHGGWLLSLEVDPAHAAVARRNLDRAGLAAVVEVRLGSARDTLPALIAEHVEPFDLIFLDADKVALPEYLDAAIRLAHPGTVIVADNVVRRGDVGDASSVDPNVRGVREMVRHASQDSRISATVLQTVGTKGYDGMFFAVVHGSPLAGRTAEPRSDRGP